MSVTAPLVRSTSADGLAVPIDFGARHGDGLHLGVSLGGGGVWFVAWQTAYVRELARLGVDLAGAQRVVGTSAGSLVGSLLEAGHLGRFERELTALARVPKLVSALAPASTLSPSQQRALDLFVACDDPTPAAITAIGHAALVARTPSAARMARNASLMLLARRWPASSLHLTTVDAHTGERVVLTERAGVSIGRAVASSSAVPGIFSTQPIGERRCMDGGVSGSGTHLDLIAGAERVVVLALVDPSVAHTGTMTQAPGALGRELDATRAAGSEVFVRTPDSVDLTRLMDPRAVPGAITMGRRQARSDAPSLRDFLG